MIEREMASPMPIPFFFVVTNASKISMSWTGNPHPLSINSVSTWRSVVCQARNKGGLSIPYRFDSSTSYNDLLDLETIYEHKGHS